MTFTYKRTEPTLWTVGHYTPSGTWIPESDHGSDNEAAVRVRFLNGGAPEPAAPEDQPDELVLSREALTDPVRLVDELTAAATAYGLAVDGSESTRRGLLHTARTLLYILIPPAAERDAEKSGGES